MKVYSTLLNDDTYESMKVPADIVQILDEQSNIAKMSRENFMREALRQYVAATQKSSSQKPKNSKLAYT